MVVLQIACLAIAASYVALRSRLEARPLDLYRRLFVLALGAWIAEDACIRAYHFHEYAAGWWLFLDKVPLAVALLWPVTAQSARDLAVCVWPGRERPSPRRVALTVLGIVFADACLIAPIAAKSGLVRWSVPGVLGVPPIGLLGGAFFAALAVAILEDAAWRYRPVMEALVVPLSPIGTHLLLLACWWGVFRWVSVPLPSWPAALVAWLTSMGLASRALRSGTRHRVPPVLLWLRAPAGVLLFALLAVYGREDALLVVYAAAFVPPCLAVLSFGAARAAPRGAG